MPTTIPPDVAVVEETLRAVRPGPLLDLPILLESLLPSEGDCPVLDTLAVNEAGEPVRELWTGGCQSGDLRIEGVLERLDHAGEQWIAGENFSISRHTPQGPELELFLDGAIEVIEQDDLLLLDASMSWCGGQDAPCADGTVTVDLRYSIFPIDGYPDSYDVTVTGVVARQTPTMIEGSWSVDLAACDSEPISGVFALRQGERHDLTLDGAHHCDTCAAWTIQGLDVPAFCNVDL